MSVAINPVAISGGPLPEGALCAYSYDPVTSCVFLTRLIDDDIPTQVATMSTHGSDVTVQYSGVLYPGVLKLILTSSIVGVVGSWTLTNSVGQVCHSESLSCGFKYDDTVLYPSTFGFTINDQDTYVLSIALLGASVNAQLISLQLPTGNGTATSYNGTFNQAPALTGVNGLTPLEVTLAGYVPLNTSWGYVRKNGRHVGVQTLAPFPPPFYDAAWHNPLDYAENTSYVKSFITYKAQSFFNSESFITLPDLSKAVKILDDIHAKNTPSCYSIALITQEDTNHQLMWRCIREQRTINDSGTNYNYYVNKWVSAERVYLYKAGGIYFGGKDYSGPSNSILVDAQDGSYGSEHRVLDLNEFPINANGEVYVHAYVCNYNTSASKVYCVLNKQSGRMAEINVNSKTVKYFTLVVPNDSEICQLYYANRLLYTVRNTSNNAFSIYDANNNGVLLYTFDLGTYNPALVPQFTIIN